MTDIAYDWAVLRVVPRVHLGASVNVAVIVHARTAGFLAMEALLDADELARRAPALDAALLARYLEASVGICRGEPGASSGHAAVALAPASERFHWLTAPRSDVIQPSAVHGGVTGDPAATLLRLYAEQVGT